MTRGERDCRFAALDPAKPAFTSKGPGERVDKTDANTVQVIHTSSIGLDEPIGDADFYPNGGITQPGCSRIGKYGSMPKSISLVGSLVNTLNSFSVPACSHSRAYEYYTESITNPTGFRAGEVFMGGPKFDPK